MSAQRRGWTMAGLVVAMLAGAGPASAQTLGPFRWQFQPFCNSVSLTLTSAPGGFTLTGTEDQCGAVDAASAVGVGSFSTSGNIALNFTIVTAPSGKPVHVSALVSPATGGGTWRDSGGNTGTFAFFGAIPGLPPRPVPSSGLSVNSVTAVEIASGAVGASELAADAITGINVVNGSLTTADLADGPRANSVEGTQNIQLTVGVNTNVRQVTLTAPAPGRIIVNASALAVASSSGVDLAECSLTTGTTVDSGQRTVVGDNAATTGILSFPMALTRGFVVNPGFFVARLICRSGAGVVLVQDTAMTAMFFPS